MNDKRIAQIAKALRERGVERCDITVIILAEAILDEVNPKPEEAEEKPMMLRRTPIRRAKVMAKVGRRTDRKPTQLGRVIVEALAALAGERNHSWLGGQIGVSHTSVSNLIYRPHHSPPLEALAQVLRVPVERLESAWNADERT